MADNTVLNLGSGGDAMRTLEDAAGQKWPASVLCYATTVSPGANVLQLVDSSNPLPVAVSGDVTVAQSTAANLKAEVTLAGGSTVGVSSDVTVQQATAANLNATAHQGGAWTVGLSGGTTVGVSGAVTVQQSTAGNLKTEVSQSTAANLNASVVQSGTWTVGLSGGAAVAVLGDVTVKQATAANLNATATLAAGTEFVGKVSAGLNSALLYSGTTALARKFAKIDASTSGNNTVVAASSGNRLRVLRWGLAADGDVSAKWRSGASTDLTGPRPLTKYASAGGAFCPVGIFETAKNEALVLNLSAAVAVGGELTYVEVPESGGVIPGDPGGGGTGAT